MLRRCVLVTLLAACGGGNGHHLADACIVSGAVTASVTGPTTYACHDKYMATVTVVNNSCDPVAIQGIKLSTTTSAGCTPAADFTYQPMVGTVPAGETQVVLDLTGGEYCCFQMACPTPFQCDSVSTFTIMTGGNPIVVSDMQHESLDGCDTVCP
jgi:hypothetical protein